MSRTNHALIAALIGAATLYYTDQRQGRRRRARLRDRLDSLRARLVRAVDPVRRDAINRARGLAAQWRPKRDHAAAPDDTIAQRVRSTLGRYVSHPRAVTVTVRAGRVELAGEVLQAEHAPLLRAVLTVPGVTGVDDALHVHASAAGVSALQGGRQRHGRRPDLLRDEWGPATRAAVGVLGCALASYGLLRSRVPWLAAGALMLVRTAANRPLAAALAARGRGAIRIQKTITVNAPVERVYATLRNYDHFPRFMHNVRAVTVRPDGTSHWIVSGPAGMSVEWDAITTDMEENRLIAWATTEDSSIDHRGVIRLVPEGGATRVHVTMTYTPLAGALGHVVAMLLGADPKSELDEDLFRMKALLEGANVPHDIAAEPA